MAVTAALVESTPDRLVYLVTRDTTGTTLTITNATLITDALKQTPLGNIVATTVANQAAARALMMGDGAPGGPAGNFLAPRAHCFIFPRTGATAWAVDANASTNAIVLNITCTANNGDAYLIIRYASSVNV